MTTAPPVSQPTQAIAITTFNVMNLNGGREGEILSALGRSQLIGLQGTCRRHQERSQVRTVLNYTCVGFPTDAGDRCAGVEMCIHNCMGKIKKVFEPPAQLKGRVGAVWVQSAVLDSLRPCLLDLLPPRSHIENLAYRRDSNQRLGRRSTQPATLSMHSLPSSQWT